MDIKAKLYEIIQRNKQHLNAIADLVTISSQEAKPAAEALQKDSAETQALLDDLHANLGDEQTITDSEKQALLNGAILPSMKDGNSIKAGKLAALSLKGHRQLQPQGIKLIPGLKLADTFITHYQLGEEELELKTGELCQFIAQYLAQDTPSDLNEAVSRLLGKGDFYQNLGKLRTTLMKTCVVALVDGYKYVGSLSDSGAADNENYSTLNAILSDGNVMKSVLDKIVNLRRLIDGVALD